MPDLDALIERLKELHAKAKQGEWVAARVEPQTVTQPFNKPYSPWILGAGPRGVSVDRNTCLHADDAEYIAALHNAFPEIMAELSRLRQSEAELNVERVELGCAGHFIAANRCRWKRHTQVGNYRISSIGDYYLGDARQTIGAGPNSYFETMVFETTGELCGGNDGCGCRVVREWDELDGERYATAGEAQAGHERYVSMYAARAALWETKK